MSKKPPPKPPEGPSKKLSSLAGKGLKSPSSLTTKQVRELAGEVLHAREVAKKAAPKKK